MWLPALLPLVVVGGCLRKGEKTNPPVARLDRIRQTFAIPNKYLQPSLKEDGSGIPFAYLAGAAFAVDGLSDAELAGLCTMLSEADRLTRERSHQSYPLETKSSLYQLVAYNFPDVKAVTTEGGTVIFFDVLAAFVQRKAAERRPVSHVAERHPRRRRFDALVHEGDPSR